MKTYIPFIGLGSGIIWARFHIFPKNVWWKGIEWNIFYPTQEQLRNGTGTQYNPGRQLLLPCMNDDEVDLDTRS